jgi:hypothetical protein
MSPQLWATLVASRMMLAQQWRVNHARPAHGGGHGGGDDEVDSIVDPEAVRPTRCCASSACHAVHTTAAPPAAAAGATRAAASARLRVRRARLRARGCELTLGPGVWRPLSRSAWRRCSTT